MKESRPYLEAKAKIDDPNWNIRDDPAEIQNIKDSEEYYRLMDLLCVKVSILDGRIFSKDGRNLKNGEVYLKAKCSHAGRPSVGGKKYNSTSSKCECKAKFKFYRSGLVEFSPLQSNPDGTNSVHLTACKVEVIILILILVLYIEIFYLTLYTEYCT